MSQLFGLRVVNFQDIIGHSGRLLNVVPVLNAQVAGCVATNVAMMLCKSSTPLSISFCLFSSSQQAVLLLRKYLAQANEKQYVSLIDQPVSKTKKPCSKAVRVNWYFFTVLVLLPIQCKLINWLIFLWLWFGYKTPRKLSGDNCRSLVKLTWKHTFGSKLGLICSTFIMSLCSLMHAHNKINASNTHKMQN